MSNEIQILPEVQLFELAQREASCYAASTLVPASYQGNVPNVMIAMNMAKRMGADPLMVMQNLYVVHGTPTWSSKFMIAGFNQLRAYTTIKYETRGAEGHKDRACRSTCTEISTNEKLEGPWVSMKMAHDEGWYGKKGSKWKTIPELMLRYRAAAFFIRVTAPEVTMGLLSQEEAEDAFSNDVPQITSLRPTASRPSMDTSEEAEIIESRPESEKEHEPTQEPIEAFGPIIGAFGECSEDLPDIDAWCEAIMKLIESARGKRVEIQDIFSNNEDLLKIVHDTNLNKWEELMTFYPSTQPQKQQDDDLFPGDT